jgi:hypothetical protein
MRNGTNSVVHDVLETLTQPIMTFPVFKEPNISLPRPQNPNRARSTRLHPDTLLYQDD